MLVHAPSRSADRLVAILHPSRGASPAPIRFPPDNFKHSLTLFSKSFTSFPRGTCSLSVSRPYLALDGIYRPIWAAFPNNPTRRQRLVVRQGPGTTGLSPSPAPPSRGLGPGPPLRTLLQTTIRTTEPPDSKAGLFPVRSPLLRESLGPGVRDARRAVAAMEKRVELQPLLSAMSIDVDSHLGQQRARGAREASICFAMIARLMIEARCERGDAMRDAQKKHRSPRRTPQMGHEGQAIDSSIPWSFPHRGSLVARRARWAHAPGMGGGTRARCWSTPPAQTPQLLNTFAGSFCCAGFYNDPSEGSPTKTLLRLVLPLNDKVQWTSRDVAGSEQPTSPRSKHFTGSFNR
ncbi:Protein TAR1 [Capsicum baccatum]|uniref:Protein TAR1 n=1 Tax=Capsicum baccatum TaxID=33114 RepID=A0A2G2UY40_CAPBA|nr:Protein TAR1 [Capsicum baccatum]